MDHYPHHPSMHHKQLQALGQRDLWVHPREKKLDHHTFRSITVQVILTIRQVVRTEEDTDLHILKEGFGLTLEGKELSWFQTLDTST